ncbi:MAG: IS200/IS605 family transposase [Pseudomonadota bacterium]
MEQTLRLPVGSDDTGKYCIFHHRYHIVWSTKYRFKVLTGDVRLRVRGICRQVGREDDVDILHGVLSSNYLHMFLSVPPRHAISYIVRKMKGRSSHKVQREFPNLRKRYWGRRFWGRRYFSTTNGAITEDIVLDYLHKHIQNPTGAGRSVV